MISEKLNREKEKFVLIATNVPEGVIVHTGLGVSQNSQESRLSLSEGQRRELGGGVKNFRKVRASDVGLEWRDASGQKIKVSDKWANESYVWISDKE